jgi:hypothetical protein
MREPLLNVSEKNYVSRNNAVLKQPVLQKTQEEAFPERKPKTINALSQKWRNSELEPVAKEELRKQGQTYEPQTKN